MKQLNLHYMTKVMSTIQHVVVRGKTGAILRTCVRSSAAAERRGRKKRAQNTQREGQEHPQGHRRVACRVQHTHMPAYYAWYLRVYGGRIKSYIQWTGRSDLPQTSPSCSGHPPVWWFHSCWSPRPSRPSPFLPECCGPEKNKMMMRRLEELISDFLTCLEYYKRILNM